MGNVSPKSLSDTYDGREIASAHIVQASRTPLVRDKTWVLVEAMEDKLAYGKFFNSERTLVYIPKEVGYENGCDNVEYVVGWFVSREPKIAVIGIRDKDYVLFVNPLHVWPVNVFATDFRDVEMLMLSSPAVRQMLGNLKNYTETKMNQSFEIARELGYLRIFNDVQQKGIRFNDTVKQRLYWDGVSVCPNWK